MNSTLTLEGLEKKDIFLQAPENVLLRIQEMREKIERNKGLQSFLENSQVFCDIIEITLQNGINIDLSIAENGNWIFQIFSDNPLKPVLPIEKSTKNSILLSNMLLSGEAGFVLRTPKHGVHNFPHYEKELPEHEIVTHIAKIGQIKS